MSPILTESVTPPTSLVLETERLRLRCFEIGDEPRVRDIADHAEVAATTLNLPHPYTMADAHTFVRGAFKAWTSGTNFVFAVETKDAKMVIGTVGLTLTPSCDRAELGYWLGHSAWGHGYATEAAQAVLRFGFATLGLNRIHATCFADNAASERVLQKLGMTREGMLRQHYKRFGTFHDGVAYGLLRSEWLTHSEPL